MRTILCFGDSNTWGYDPESGPRTERYPREVRWPCRLARALGDEWEVIAEGLNGRTATRDDPIWEGRNGLTYLLPCLRSHAPLDLVVIYLGTNDVAERHSLPAEDVAASVGRLVKVVRTSETGPGESAPDVLVVCPPPFGTLDPLYAAAGEKSRQLGKWFAVVCEELGCELLDLDGVAGYSDLDGIHLDADGHAAVATAVEGRVHARFAS
jgi:lysophospholipase L1-like esterase